MRFSSSLRRSLAVGAAVLSSVAALAVAPSPASADVGHNGCLSINAPGDGFLYTTQSCGVSATYHIRRWVPQTGYAANGGNYSYFGLRTYGKYVIGARDGDTVCAELFEHKRDGGYGSWGLPCTTVG